MFPLGYISRDNTTSVNGETMFCCFHPADSLVVFEKVSDDVLQISDTLILYRKEEETTSEKEYDNLFSHITCVIVLITKQLLENTMASCRADLAYAIEHHVPLFPILCEAGMETDFSNEISHFHAINIDSETYKQKLKQFIDKFSNMHEAMQTTENVFRGKLFISYRKKDYKAILPCMRALHRSEFFRDIAIWYDAYLHEGENFDDEIRKNIEEANAVVVIATDNVWSDVSNYVLKHEIPLAEQLNKKILYINYNLKQYGQEKGFIKLHDNDRIAQFLLDVFGKGTQLTPQQQYLLGVSYLNGFYTEKDATYALEYLTLSAQALYKPAMKKLAEIYCYGYGVERSKQKTLDYQTDVLETFQKEFVAKKSENNGVAFLKESLRYLEMAKEFGDSQKGLFAIQQVTIYDNDFCDLNSVEVSNLLGRLYREAATIYFWADRFKDSRASFLSAEKVINEETPFTGHREKLLNMSENALLMLQCGDTETALLRLVSVLCSFWQLFQDTKLLAAAQDYVVTLARFCYILPKLEEEELKLLPFDPSALFDELINLSEQLYNKTRVHNDLFNYARAYFYLAEWLGKSDDRHELMKANGAYIRAYKLMAENYHDIKTFNERKFFITTIQRIGDSYMILFEFAGARNVYNQAYDIAMEIYENDSGNIWVLQKLSVLSEGLGDSIREGLKSGDLSFLADMSPDTLYMNSIEIEEMLFGITKDCKSYIQRKVQLERKRAGL